IEEALDKIKYGMKIIIREGSAAKNFEALIGLMGKYPEKLMFCSDDRHPNDLEKCHINDLVKRAIKKGYDPVTVLRSCVYNPVKHYGLEVGLLQEGDPADFIIIDNFDNFNVLATYIDGTKVAENGKTLIDPITDSTPNNFRTKQIKLQDLQITPQSDTVKVIHAIDGQLITNKISAKINIEKNNAESNTKNDVLKLVVTNRYEQAKPAIAFINNFGIKNGAIASSVAHDSHNIIAVGVEDEDIMNAVNLLIKEKGGVSLANADEKIVLPLHVAGLMSNKDCYLIASEYDSIDKKAKKLGSKLNAPYMTLSFMALLVIPELKLSDKGLFDGNRFEFTPLFE
ncbi:MAG: adenine deaminase, partial [Bacteroidales bacterium]|nr:adenine deaminase [Bacteroidales bacterium]